MDVKGNWRRLSSPWNVDYWRRGKEEGGVDPPLWCCGCFWLGWVTSMELDGPPAWVHGVVGSQCSEAARIDMRSGLIDDRDSDTTHQTASYQR